MFLKSKKSFAVAEEFEPVDLEPLTNTEKRAGWAAVSLLYEQTHNYIRHYDQRLVTINTLFVTIGLGALSIFINDAMNVEKLMANGEITAYLDTVYGQSEELKELQGRLNAMNRLPVFLVWFAMLLSVLGLFITQTTNVMRKRYAYVAMRIERAMTHFIPEHGEEKALALVASYIHSLSGTGEQMKGPLFIRAFTVLYLAIFVIGSSITFFPGLFGLPEFFPVPGFIEAINGIGR